MKRRDGAPAHGAGGPRAPLPGRTTGPSGRPELSWPDARLVRECVRGNEDAWAALLDRYKNLVFSVPVKRGIPRDDAADVFQRVCLLLLAELPRLRDAQALPMWLIRVTAHECERWRRQEHPYAARETAETAAAELPDERPLPEDVLAQLTQEQVLRDAVRSLSPRCRRLIAMLFYETPPRPYLEVARQLGLASGSIGFIRGRCLTRLRRALEQRRFR